MNRLFVGMDVHKEKIVVVGLPEEGNHCVFREEFGGNDLSRLIKRLKRLGKSSVIEACYEAGPCGYGLARGLIETGICCRIAAPSLIPRRPGDRIKTDGRDALDLALALRAGTLSFVRIPTREEEQVRGLVRCREDVAKEVRRLKHIVAHFLLVRGARSPREAKRWSTAHWRWVRALELSPMDRVVLDHYLDLLLFLSDRLRQVEAQIRELSETELYRERVERLKTFKGFSSLAAMRVIAEVMDFGRFPKATSFMKFAGLVPSEHSSSDRIRRGKITKAGNSHLRCVLVEAIQGAHRSNRLTRPMAARIAAVAGNLRQVALSCLTRLHHKFWMLAKRGVPLGKVRIAMARELAGFVWAMMTAPETRTA